MKRNNGYNSAVTSGWLNPLVEIGEGVNLSFTINRQQKDKILPKIAQTTMVNRSRMRDVGDTRQDYEELDSAIMSGLWMKDENDGFNCLEAIADDKALVQTIAEVIIENASNQNERQDFWEKAEMNLLMALHYVQGKKEKNSAAYRTAGKGD